MNANEMKARLVEVVARATKLHQEGKDVAALLTEADTLQARIAQAEKVEAFNAPRPRTGPGAIQAARSAGNLESRPAARFEAEAEGEMSMSDYVRAVALNPESIRAAQTTFAGEGTPADGGYAAPTEYSRIIVESYQSPESFVGLCDSLSTVSNSIDLPVDEDEPWSATGLTVGDVAEGAPITASKPLLSHKTFTLAKKAVLVPVSEELLEDGVDIGGYVARKSAAKLLWRMNAAAYAAFLASPAKVTVAKTGGAAAGSPPDIQNILDIWVSVPAALRESAVWFANPKLEAALLKMVIPNTTIPAFLPAGGLAASPFATLLGKRIIWTEQSAAVGTVGDIALVCPRNFYAITKGGPKAAVSPHLYFDQGLVAYRTTVRLAVASKRTAVITRPDATTVGDVAVLATRA